MDLPTITVDDLLPGDVGCCAMVGPLSTAIETYDAVLALVKQIQEGGLDISFTNTKPPTIHIQPGGAK